MKVRRLRKAYQRVFMPSISNSGSFEDRLTELVYYFHDFVCYFHVFMFYLNP
jgi:hypothetical protein